MRRMNVLKALCITGALTFGQAAAVCPLPTNPTLLELHDHKLWCEIYPDNPACEILGNPGRIGRIGQVWGLYFEPTVYRPTGPVSLKDSDGNRINLLEGQEVYLEIKDFDKENSLVRGTLEILPPPAPERGILDTLFSEPPEPVSSSIYENATLSCDDLRDYAWWYIGSRQET